MGLPHKGRTVQRSLEIIEVAETDAIKVHVWI